MIKFKEGELKENIMLARDYFPPVKYGAKWLSSDSLSGFDDFATVRYVDGDNGSDSENGLTTSSAFATIQGAIDASSARDIIYIRAMAPESDASEPGTYVEDLTIPYAKNGLKLIGMSGTGSLQPFSGPKIKNATATALLTVNAPYVQISGLQFNCTRNSGTYGIYLTGNTGYTTAGGSVGFLIDNCYIKNASATYGGISVYGGYSGLISRCTFALGTDCLAINLDCNTLPNNGHTIEYCNFKSNNGASVALHVSLENSKDVNVNGCNFDQATKFITVVDGCTGVISNCCFNDGSSTTTAKSTGKIEIPAANDEVGVVGCYGGGNALIAQDGA